MVVVLWGPYTVSLETRESGGWHSCSAVGAVDSGCTLTRLSIHTRGWSLEGAGCRQPGSDPTVTPTATPAGNATTTASWDGWWGYRLDCRIHCGLTLERRKGRSSSEGEGEGARGGGSERESGECLPVLCSGLGSLLFI